MKKAILGICLALMFVGCSEEFSLEREIRVLKVDIQTAKKVETLRVERDSLQAELDSFETRAETNSDVAPVSSQFDALPFKYQEESGD